MLVKFLYGLMLKRIGKKKEGMKVLKEIEYEGDGAIQVSMLHHFFLPYLHSGKMSCSVCYVEVFSAKTHLVLVRLR